MPSNKRRQAKKQEIVLLPTGNALNNKPTPIATAGKGVKNQKRKKMNATSGVSRALVTQVAEKVKASLSPATRSRLNPVALSITLPVAHVPIRVPGLWKSVPTAVARLHNVTDVTWANPGTIDAGSMFEPGQVVAMVSKDPLHAYAVSSTDIEESRYWLNSKLTDNLLAPSDFTVGCAASTVMFDPAILTTCADANPSGVQGKVHGDYYFPFSAANANGVYLTSTAANQAQFEFYRTSGNIADPTNCRYVIHKFNGSTWVEKASTAIINYNSGGVDHIIVPPGRGLYRCGIFFGSTTAANGSVGIVVNVAVVQKADIFGFSPIPGLMDHYEEIETLNITACSLMMSPNVSDLDLAGIVASVQLQPTEPFDSHTTYDAIVPLDSSDTRSFKKGVYAFHMPANDDELNVHKPFTVEAEDELSTTNAPFLSVGGWLVTAIKVPLTEGAYPSGNAYFTTNFSVEYTTNSQWDLQVTPRFTREQYMDMWRVVRDIPQFHENPMHFSDIVSFLKRSGRTALRVAPTLLKALATVVAPEYRAAILAGSTMTEAIQNLVRK